MKTPYVILLFAALASGLSAQTVVTLNGRQVVQSGGYIVLSDADWVNNGRFAAQAGEVVLAGEAPSAIKGTSSTTFHNLTIDKNDQPVRLGRATTVNNALHLTGGLLDIGDHDLSIAPGGRIAEVGEQEYIKTSGTGTLHQTVSDEGVDFPVGGASYKPLFLRNTGEVDVFKVRVEEAAYLAGAAGDRVMQDAVDASWHIEEAVAGGSAAQLSFRWSDRDELPGFDRRRCTVGQYKDGALAQSTKEAAEGTLAYWRTVAGIATFGSFTISSQGLVQHSTVQPSIGRPSTKPHFTLYPNPATDYVIIEQAAAGEWAQLLSIQGQLLKEFQISSSQHALSLNDIPKGSYLIKVGSTAGRIVIQ
ncbi:MAG: T9SS type A sorting domain-containing protein [Bacteroidota bacterium]